MNKERYSDLLPRIFDILYSNMSDIAPTGNDYVEDFRIWSEGFSSAVDNGLRRVILIYDDDDLIGYFQYVIIDSTFKMEEIQFEKEYQGVGVFQKLYAYLNGIVPETVKTVEANANKKNQKSLPKNGKQISMVYSSCCW